MRMSEDEAFATFAMLRWPDTEGEAVCPHCGHDKCYLIKTRRRFKCAACRKQFSITSGTIFHSAKLELRDYLAVIALFVNAVKGISALQVSRDVDISYKAAFVLLHKLREAIDGTRSDITLSGEVEIDGAYYGGHVRPSNGGREGRKPSKKRRKKCVLTLVQRGGATVTKVIPSENTDDVLDIARKHIAQDSVVFADEHGAYDVLHARYEVYRINHRWSYSDGIACTNQAESFHARMRRAEIGQYHRISNRYLSQYASEIAYRSDRKRVDNGTVFSEVTEMALATPASRTWIGYWQKRAV
ncbi:IS1595 family transposase [Kordiimonas lipolytica]|uniref:IS1595 family transposase n=1 Tax=Kordiimonas lipolytica TaxID=1662421 RepID=A0ABV8UE07_9PROT|nr:IS1595 family transposase [Kordiimonas lipolytica]